MEGFVWLQGVKVLRPGPDHPHDDGREGHRVWVEVWRPNPGHMDSFLTWITHFISRFWEVQLCKVFQASPHSRWVDYYWSWPGTRWNKDVVFHISLISRMAGVIKIFLEDKSCHILKRHHPGKFFSRKVFVHALFVSKQTILENIKKGGQLCSAYQSPI